MSFNINSVGILNIGLFIDLKETTLLKYILNKKNTNFQEHIQILMDIAHSLKLFFEGNIVHGDIKPENILLNINPDT